MIRANIPTFIVISALIAGVIWAAMSWSYGTVISNQTSEIKLLERQKAEASAIPKQGALVDRASVRLHIYGDTRLPDRLGAVNIWRWFYMHGIIVLTHPDGSKNQDIVTATLFVSFDQPVNVGSIKVRADKPLPNYEVKEFNNRFAIIAFLGPVPECNLDIDVSP